MFEAPDLMDEDADEVDEDERISMGTAWCNDTMLGLALPCTLLPIIDWVDIWSLNAWWWLNYPYLFLLILDFEVPLIAVYVNLSILNYTNTVG